MTEAHGRGHRHTGDENPRIGSLAEEANKLFETLRGPGGSGGGLGAELGEVFRDLDHHLASGDDCRYCPVCRLIGLARQPEVRQHLTSAAGSLAAALASALATPSPEASRSGQGPDLMDDGPS
jgi:hypothetical protein